MLVRNRARHHRDGDVLLFDRYEFAFTGTLGEIVGTITHLNKPSMVCKREEVGLWLPPLQKERSALCAEITDYAVAYKKPPIW